MSSPGRLLGTLFALCMLAAPVRATERILDFHSDIQVNPDASLDVTETIRVLADGTRIKHGILRSFPTDYVQRNGYRVRVGFELISASVDDSTELDADYQSRHPWWRTEPYANGVRIYLGDQDAPVDPGQHTYTVHYRTTRQLGFFGDHDELYWNVTGNDWKFPIDHASAKVNLPGAIPAAQIQLAAFTGSQGSKGHDFRSAALATGQVTFETTAPLKVQEGLTIVVGFPKGNVAAPATAQRLDWLWQDNKHLVVAAVGLLAMYAYLLLQWWRVGRDPRRGPIMPQYDAPTGLSPGALRYVENMRYDDRCFAADVVDLGVRGTLQIRQDDKTFTLKPIRGADLNALPPIEAKMHTNLIAPLGDFDELELSQRNQSTIAKARAAHARDLEQTCAAPNFRKNGDKLAIGAAIGFVTLLAMDWLTGFELKDSSGRSLPIFVLLFLVLLGTVIGGFAYTLVASAIAQWRKIANGGSWVRAILVSLVSIPLALLCTAVFCVLGWPAGYFGMGVAFLLTLGIHLFYVLLPAPTAAGRKLLDQIAGLRMYLGVAERDDLTRMQAPAMTEKEFQRFLPYALALDVAKTWCSRFAQTIGPAAAAAAAATSFAWYQGSLTSFDSFGDQLGSTLSDSIASSATAPGSSSGFSGGDSGGGGSSGGGGGGGGGDGW